jgi:hypothetical protein
MTTGTDSPSKLTLEDQAIAQEIKRLRVGKCPVCGVLVESDMGPGCSEHRVQVAKANKEKMAALREKKEAKDVSTD